MKSWHHTLLGLFIGMAATAVLFLVTAPPRGASVELLPAPTAAPILVHIDGAVQHPGVYALPRDSRIQEAIQAAGGFSQQANQDAVNMAARLKDGDKLIIPAAGTPAVLPQASQPTVAKAKGPAQGSAQSVAKVTPGAPVNINTATLDELQTLPGIGATRAQQIIDYRQAHGNFKTIDELQNVTGIGPATYEKLKDWITVD